MAEAQTTKLGTPISPRWTRSWAAKVESVEKQMGRRICGAHSPAWTPCKLSSTHPNGRCRFHGGAEGIGAPNGNWNALIHGLYARRLQRCGMQCPVWQWCPMAGKDVLALDPKERPACVYEREEYDNILNRFTDPTFSLGKEKVGQKKPIASAAAVAAPDAQKSPLSRLEANAGSHPPTDPVPIDERTGCDATASDPDIGFSLPTFSFPKEKVGAVPLLYHNIATYQVMLTRAQAALAVSRLVDDTIAEGERYSMKSSKVAALLQAELRIGRELRQWIRLLANDAVRFALGLGPAKPEDPEPERVLSLPDMMVPILKKAEGVLERALEPRRPKPGPSTA